MGEDEFLELKSCLESKHGALHHINPTSRAKELKKVEWNLYPWTAKKHRAFHRIFYNYFPSDCIRLIKGWTSRRGRLIEAKIGEDNLKDWLIVFGNYSSERAIRFIKIKFLPAEIRYFREYKNTRKIKEAD